MRSIQINTPEGVAGVKRITGLLEELADRKAAMEDHMNAVYAQLQRAIAEEVQEVWQAMLDEASIPPDERHCWYLNTEFFERHGQAFLVQNENLAKELATIQSTMMDKDKKS